MGFDENPDSILAENTRKMKTKKQKRSPLERLGKRAPNHVS